MIDTREIALLTARLVLLLLSICYAGTFYRLVRGPSLPDRVVALDMLVTLAVGMMATYAIITEETAILDAGVVVALVIFLGTVAFASYLERGGPR